MEKKENDSKDRKKKRISLWAFVCALSIAFIAAMAPASEHYDAEYIAFAKESPEINTTQSNSGSPASSIAENTGSAYTDIPSFSQSPIPSPSPSAREYVSDDMNFVDASTEIHIRKIEKDNLVYYLSDVKIEHPSQLKTAFAQNKFGKNYRAYSSKIAADNSAILAMNGDYYGFRNQGIVIRNGTLFRDQASKNSQLLIIDANGDFRIEEEEKVDADALVDEGVMHTLSFGPALVIDSEIALPDDFFLSFRAKEPRTAICQIDELHYLIVTVDGRRKGYSEGVTLEELAKICLEEGCKIAYNLDGGGSATLVMNGKVANRVSGGGERSVSDIVYFSSMD